MTNKIVFENKYVKIIKAELTNLGSIYTCVSISSGGNFYLHNCPTNNCQISSIGSCENIMFLETFENIIESLHDSGYITHQLLVDVYDTPRYRDQIDNLKFDKVFRNRYTSTNNSEMIMYLLRLRDIQEQYDNDNDDDDEY